MAHALGYPESEWIQPEDRLQVLARLRRGAGVEVITGPEGAPFWLLASIEVVVSVQPDGYTMKERSDELVWSLRQAGCTAQEAGQLARRVKPPTPAHKLYQAWCASEGIRESLPVAVAEVNIDWEPIHMSIGDAAKWLKSTRDPLALDYEWDIETKIATEFGAYDGSRTVYVKLDTPDEVRLAASTIGQRLRLGLPSIWHGGRADLGIHLPYDPAQLVDTPPHDSMIVAYLCGEPELGLKVLTPKLLKRHAVELPPDLEHQDLALRARYVCADVRNSFDIFNLCYERLRETNQLNVYEDIERPIMPIIASMEKYGVPVNIEYVIRRRDESLIIERGIEDFFHEQGVEIEDDAATLVWLTGILGFNPGTLDQRVVSWWPNPEIDLMLFYRGLKTERRSFLEKTIKLWEAKGCPPVFYIHPGFNQAGDPEGKAAPRTGRMSSSGEMNLQNQPGDIKEMYVAPPGKKWWDYDYSGVELRTGAIISGDKTMLKAIKGGASLHEMLQDRVFDITGSRPPKVAAKKWNFGKLFGGQLDRLIEMMTMERIWLDKADAQALDRAHASLFPDYPRWAKRVVSKAEKDGFAITWWGRRRYIPELYDNDPKVRAHGGNAAVNHTVQGSAADLIKMAMAKLVRVGFSYSSHLSTQVHDATGGWVDEDQAYAWNKLAPAVMGSIRLVDTIPMLVEGGYGDNWAACHA